MQQELPDADNEFNNTFQTYKIEFDINGEVFQADIAIETLEHIDNEIIQMTGNIYVTGLSPNLHFPYTVGISTNCATLDLIQVSQEDQEANNDLIRERLIASQALSKFLYEWICESILTDKTRVTLTATYKNFTAGGILSFDAKLPGHLTIGMQINKNSSAVSISPEKACDIVDLSVAEKALLIISALGITLDLIPKLFPNQ